MIYTILVCLGAYLAFGQALILLGQVVPMSAFIGRVMISYLALIICALYGALASIYLRLNGDGQIAQWATARAFKYVMYYSLGLEFRVVDPKGHLDKVRPAVFIGNHQTELDVLMLACIWPKYCSVTAKSSLANYPFLGWFMRLSGSIFIDRKNTKDARQAMAGAAAEIQSKRQSVYMFPEGTRSYAKDPMLLPFKKGAFHLAIEAQVPIVPCVVANYSHILYIKDFVFNTGSVPVKVLDPIPTTGLTADDVEELARTTRELMLQEHLRLTALARHIPAARLEKREAEEADKSGADSAKSGVVKASGVEVR